MTQQSRTAEFEELTAEEATQMLDTDPQRGLSEDEAQRRLERYGENVVEEERRSRIIKFLSHFWGPIPWMIEAALVLAAAVQRWEELGVIAALLAINVGVSYWHESKASNAIEALKAKLAPETIVLRDGRSLKIPASRLVPGDIVKLRMGDVVPADAKMLDGQYLSVDESSLTGESLPVDKETGKAIYSGTSVKQGEGMAVTVSTGRSTKFARTVELVEAAGQASHFQRAVIRIGYFLMGLVLLLVLVIVAVSLVRQEPWVEVVLFSLGLTIAGIPVALPAILSVTMAVGANRLTDMKAIVSKLAAIEEMAGLEVLCADKTGTLTKNQLELQQPVLVSAKNAHELILSAALTARRDGGDPIDEAVIGGLDDPAQLDSYRIAKFRPFDPKSKRAEADVEADGKTFTVAKGAPQVILDLVGVQDEEREDIESEVGRLGVEGFRALGVARKDADGVWNCLGILPLLDPPQEDSSSVVRAAKDHGIDIRMVTGDHRAIAKQVARQLGLGEDIRVASELFREGEGTGDTKTEDNAEVSSELLAADGFAEVTPEHKFKIVRQFQANDRIVGMTGDGVNDAPALKQADVGIAVPGAIDAARSAATLVLTEQGLAVMTRAVEEARRIFERMTSYATYRITETIRLVVFVAVSILVFDFFPVTAIMIVLLAVLNDIPIMAIAWDNARTARHPVRWDMPRVLFISAVLGLGGVVSSFLLFWFLRTQTDLATGVVQTLLFLKLLVAGHMTLFLTRTRGAFWEKPLPSLSLFLALEATQLAGTLVAVYGWLIEPIGWGYAGAVWGYAIVWMLLLNGLKVGGYSLLKAVRASRLEEQSVA
jgi:H+-transporting ATPase